MSLEKNLINFKQPIKTVGWVMLFVLLVSVVAQKGANESSIAPVYLILVLMNSVTIVWLTLAIFNSEYRRKKLVSVLTPFISTTIITIFFLVLFFNAN